VLDDAGWRRVVKDECDRAGIATMNLPTGLRTRVTEAERFWFNHLPHDIKWDGKTLPAAGVIRQVKQ
jgi:beta-galactosidase